MSRVTDSALLSPVWAGSGDGLSDEAWLAAMLEVEVALARAQAALGVVPERAAEVIADVAGSARLDVADIAVRSREAANPVVVLVQRLTAAVAEVDPAAAEHVHRGGTSQDVLDSAAVLLASRTLRGIDGDLVRSADALARLADRHRHTVLAGRTMAQHAVPITFGLKAAGWLAGVLDASDRVRRTTADLPVQLGGAAGTLASYEAYAGRPGHGVRLAREFATRLGLREPDLPWHARRTPLLDLGWALTAVTGALGKIALDVQGMSRTEVGELAEPSAEGRGASSAMPQKRNPVLATLLVSAARTVPAQALVLGQALLAEDERAPGAWHSEWQPLREALRTAAGAAATAVTLLEGLEVFPGRMRANLDLSGGAIVAERLNVVLAPQLGKAGAKALLGRLAREAAAGERPFADLLREVPELDADRVHDLLNPERYLGAAADLIDRVLARHRDHG
ncbi:class-II fumarase/aspartase family protein [Saccharothrix syringae]|uniref:class-II fumarase/aspartase family protein n=1 Tax=Saccharothrix syringae TaxID=103733 RepID=UPI00052762BF|nr:adenylosuccinate lyase family protein [Saccharothrix syringae]